MHKKMAPWALATVLASTAAAPAVASEHAVGQPLATDHLIIQPVYLQAVEMAPAMPGLNKNADIHLELDVHADKDNPRGFAPGAWIPYLTVSYQIQKKDSDWSTFGTLMAMTADDGPHYGANVTLAGPGKYTASFRVQPPPYQAFFRHKTKDTGVPGWWQPIVHSWNFTYVGVGKKGGY